MAGNKTYEMQYRLSAIHAASFNSTFSVARQQVMNLQGQIDALNKTNSDVEAYQKQQAAVDSTAKKLELYRQQLANVQKEAEQTGSSSSSLANKELTLQDRVDRTKESLEAKTAKLQQMGDALNKAGVDTNNLSGETERLNGQISGLKGQEEKAASEAEDYGQAGSNAMVAVADALAAAGVAAAMKEIYDAYRECIGAAEDYEYAMAKVETIADASAMGDMSEELKDVAEETGETSTDIAEAAYQAISAGVQTANTVSFVDTATKLAVAGFTESSDAVDVLTTAINAYGLSADDAEAISSKLILTQNLGKITVDQLAQYMGRVIPSASAYNVSIDELCASYALLTKNGISARYSTTYLAGMLDELADTGSNVSAVIKSETGQSFSDLMSEGYSLGDVIQILGKHVNDDATAFSNLWSDSSAAHAAISLFNTGAEQYDAVVSEMTNSTGTLDKAYEIMEDTGTKAAARMTTAWGNLKIAVGDDLSPAIEGLHNTMADVIEDLDTFVENNPTLVKSVSAFAAVVATAATVLTAYAAIAKVVKTLEIGSVFASFGGWAFAGAAVALGALTAGIVAVSSAVKNSQSEYEKMDSSSENAYNQLQKLNAEYKEVCDTYGENSYQAVELKKKIDDLNESYEENKTTVEDQKEAYADLIDSIEQATNDYNDAIDEIDDEYDSAESLTGRLSELMSQTSTTAAEQQEMASIVDILNEKYGDLGLKFDSTTGSVNMTAAAIEALIKAEAAEEKYEQNKQTVKDLEAAQGTLKTQIIEYTQEAADAQAVYNDALDDYNAAKAKADKYTKNDKERAAATASEAEALAQASGKLEGYNNDLANANAEFDQNQSQIDALTQEMADYANGTDDAADATGNVTSAVNTAENAISDLITAYDQAYSAALSSIQGQYDIWDTAKDVTATSVDSMNSSIQSQIAYWQSYNDNLENLKNRNIEGLSEMVASFSDGSEQSVDAIAGMASASDDDLTNMVANWQTLQQEQETTSGSMADLDTDFDQSMDDILTTLQQTIDGMNMDDEASQAAYDTIQAYIDGISSKTTAARNAAAAVAAAAAAGLNSGSSSQSSKGQTYASGTDSAEPGVALVGEEGPEMVLLRGGEKIYTAEETAAIMNLYRLEAAGIAAYANGTAESGSSEDAQTPVAALSRSAEPFAPVFAPVYQITVGNGADADAIRDVLEAHDQDMKEYIIDVVEAHYSDVERRVYR